MAFSIERFVSLRPVLFHTTRPENLAAIRADGSLRNATALRGGPPSNGRPRADWTPIRSAARTTYLCDQQPLNLAAADWEPGWNGRRWLERLDELIFLWPGDGNGPIAYGRRHLGAYRRGHAGGGPAPRTLRIPTADLLAENPHAVPLFCKYNSGAPTFRARSPRGDSTFLPANAAAFTAGTVKEVVFEGGPLRLPRSTALVDESFRPAEPFFG